MVIETTKQTNATLIKVSGRMDAVTSLQFETVVSELSSAGETRIIVDCKELDYISSAGLRSLLATGKQLKNNGGKIYFVNVTEMVKKVFDFSGLNSIFQIHDSIADALARIS